MDPISDSAALSAQRENMSTGGALALCVSLANLFHLHRWYDILIVPFSRQADRSVYTTGLLVVISSIAIMSAGSFGAYLLSRRFPLLRLFTRWVSFILLFLCVLIAAGVADPRLVKSSATALKLGAGVLFFAAGFVWYRSGLFRRRVGTLVAAGVLSLPAFVVQTVLIADQWPYSAIPRQGRMAVDQSAAGADPGWRRPGPRVIWMVFDELDEYLAFEAADSSERLPRLKQLRAESFHSGAVVPANYFTIAAIPSMLNGRPLRRSQTVAGMGEAERAWNSSSNLLGLLRSERESIAILNGEELNYCRLLGADATRCYSVTLPYPAHRYPRDPIMLARYWRENIQFAPIVPRMYLAARNYVRSVIIPRAKGGLTSSRPGTLKATAGSTGGNSGETLDLMNQQLPALLTGPYDFVYIHWPIPHPALPGRTVAGISTGYLDNLPLVDATVGNVRGIMESAGLWDDSVIVIGSDHHYRLDLWKPRRESREFAATGGQEHERIPLLIKMRHETRAVEYDRPFNALLMHDLMLNLAKDRIVNPDQLTMWLDRNRGRFPTASVPEKGTLELH